MKNVLKKLIQDFKVSYDWKAFERLSFENLDLFFPQCENLFKDPLFHFKFDRITVGSINNIPESFILFSEKPIFIKRVGSSLLSENKKQIKDIDIIGLEIIYIKQYPKKLTAKLFIENIFFLFPKYNFLLICAFPFVIIPAFYANLFNTRMIYNHQVSTLIYVTLALLIVWCGEYLIKYHIKKQHLNLVESNSLSLERYILSIMPFFKHPHILMKARMLESNRKSIWDNLSGIILDLVNFTFSMSLLIILIGKNALFILFYFIIILIIAIFFRYRSYKLYISLEAAQQDLLLERISFYKNNEHLRFFDKSSTLNNFENSCKKSFNADHDLATFNFNWEEFVRLSSFLASFVLFCTIFFTSKGDTGIYDILIALLILNGRVSGSVSTIVSKCFAVLIATYHLNQSFEKTFDQVDERLLTPGFTPKSVDSITLKNIDILIGKQAILEQVNLEFKKGHIYGFFGLVGVGKSTLMSTIIQRHTNYHGSIYINNFHNALDIDPLLYEHAVSYIEPCSDFIRGSVFMNFYMRGIRDIKKITEICQKILPKTNIDYQFIFNRDMTNLPISTGQKRKFLLFMALAKQKQLIVLDEAFINLPDAEIESILDLVRNELQNSIVLIVTHNINILNQLENLYELKNKSVTRRKGQD